MTNEPGIGIRRSKIIKSVKWFFFFFGSLMLNCAGSLVGCFLGIFSGRENDGDDDRPTADCAKREKKEGVLRACAGQP